MTDLKESAPCPRCDGTLDDHWGNCPDGPNYDGPEDDTEPSDPWRTSGPITPRNNDHEQDGA